MSNSKEIEGIVQGMIVQTVEAKAFELVDVEYVKEGSNWYLRVYIDKSGGISIDDCQSVSEEISKLLDKNDPIPSSYFLEVSSPGLERTLKKEKDFERHKGQLVEVKLFKPLDGEKTFQGELIGLKDNKVIISSETGGMIEFDRNSISTVKTVFIMK